jgi:hypothetical protein
MGVLRSLLRFVKALQDYSGLMMAVLTVFIVVFSLQSTRAARDAARAARDQVALGSIPYFAPGARGLAGYDATLFKVPAGYQGALAVIATPKSPFTRGPGFGIALALRNEGSGYGVLRGWRLLAESSEHGINPALFAPPDPFDIDRHQIVRPLELFRLSEVLYGGGPPYLELRQGKAIALQTFFTDLTGKQKYTLTLVAVRRTDKWIIVDKTFDLGWY